MTVALTGTAGLYTRLGRFGDEYLRVVSSYGSTLDAAIEDVRDEFESGAQGVVIDGIYAVRNAYRTVHGSYLSSLQTMMRNCVIEQVNDDSPLVSRTLQNALLELISQMTTNNESILRGTTGSTTTAYSGNKGDAKFVTSFVNKYGQQLVYPYPETIKFTCTSDSSNYNEVFTYAGQPLKDVIDKDWPGGSGCSGSITLHNGASNGILSNTNFATWSNSSAPPDSWTFVTGSAGSTILRDTTVKRTGVGYAVQFVGDGSTQHEIKQQLSSSAISANQVLCFQGWAKMSASDANAVLRVRLVDGGGTVVSNDAGTNLSATFDCNSTIGTSFTSISAFFQLPRQLPSTGVFISISISSGSIDTGKTLNLSLLGLREAVQLYAAGPYVGAFSAALAHSNTDYFSNAITNSVGNATWVRATQRWLGIDRLGEQYVIPNVAGSETVPDSLLA